MLISLKLSSINILFSLILFLKFNFFVKYEIMFVRISVRVASY